jgi:hypothetical protein
MFKSPNHPSLGQSVPGEQKIRWCPCGKELGMYPVDEKPTCGDENCQNYLEDNPDWYDNE